jgi:hypothetical protein
MPVEGLAEPRAAWSPDGQWIAAAGSTASGDSGLGPAGVAHKPSRCLPLDPGAGNDRAGVDATVTASEGRSVRAARHCRHSRRRRRRGALVARAAHVPPTHDEAFVLLPLHRK